MTIATWKYKINFFFSVRGAYVYQLLFRKEINGKTIYNLILNRIKIIPKKENRNELKKKTTY